MRNSGRSECLVTVTTTPSGSHNVCDSYSDVTSRERWSQLQFHIDDLLNARVSQDPSAAGY